MATHQHGWLWAGPANGWEQRRGRRPRTRERRLAGRPSEQLIVECWSCSALVKVTISVDGFFEYACKSCRHSTTWRLLGYELPMTLDLLGAAPRPEREPRGSSVRIDAPPSEPPHAAPSAPPGRARAPEGGPEPAPVYDDDWSHVIADISFEGAEPPGFTRGLAQPLTARTP